MTSPAIETVGLSRRYGARTVVRDVSLTVKPGERVALVGHNGAGKSTLIKMLLGVVAPSEGSVAVLGADPNSRAGKHLRFDLGFLPENMAFPLGITGREALDFYARLKRQPGRRNAERLAEVGLADAADQRIATYSKGMCQRLGLAQALIGKPRLLLLDEPTSGLDPVSRQRFYAIVRDLAAAGTAVLMSSHVLTEIEGQTDTIAVMCSGRLVACGGMDVLREAAALPTRIRVRLLEDVSLTGLSDGWLDVAMHVEGRRIEMSCPPAAKMDIVRQIAASHAVQDVEVLPASLDALYARFLENAA
jgi:Cu-processing system ATP-binding protein